MDRQIKELPILFSTPMVRAILDGRKTMTRRTVKVDLRESEEYGYTFPVPRGLDKSASFAFSNDITRCGLFNMHCPYGSVGDILWVRETFYSGYILDDNDLIGDDSEFNYWFFADTRDARPADMSDSKCAFLFGNDKKDWPHWKPSIHMQKTAARIWLEVTDIRVERLQDISEPDAIAEGIECVGTGFKSYHPFHQNELQHLYNNIETRDSISNPRISFFSLWASINGCNGVKGAHSFVDNPWVWVITFKVLSTTGKPVNLHHG